MTSHTHQGRVYRPVWQQWTLVREARGKRGGEGGRGEGTKGREEGRGEERRREEQRGEGGLRKPDPRPGLSPLSSDWRERIQTARIERRLSISELAEKVQCDAPTLAAFERGAEVVDAELMGKLRRELGV